jgi:hypothetical protein
MLGCMDEHDLLIQWTLDLMHCEMNFVKNILKTITSEKDNIKIRHDLQLRRCDLLTHPQAL